MTKISLYPNISSPEGDDVLIGTDKHNTDATKNFTIDSLFAIGLETNVSKLKIYDQTLMGYGEMTIDNDVLTIIGAPDNTRKLIQSSAEGFMSFKKANFNIKFDATSSTDHRTYLLPDLNGTIALQSAASGTFISNDSKTITVVNGIITSIV